jgi:hypothetical protein
MDVSILFKINSETDEQMLLKIYNTTARRINTLRAFKIVQKAKEEKPERPDALPEKI